MNENLSLETLRHIATLVNFLAKRLDGDNKALAQRIKTLILSDGLIQGWARPNGAPTNGMVGIDIASDPPTRLHVPVANLKPQARARLFQALREANLNPVRSKLWGTGN